MGNCASKCESTEDGTFTIEFNTFIPKTLSGAKTLNQWFPGPGFNNVDTWVDEAGGIDYVMKTDNRGFGGGSSRFKSTSVPIDVNDIGNLEGKGAGLITTTAGISERAYLNKRLAILVFESKTAKATQKVTVKDISPCQTNITIKASAEYPFNGGGFFAPVIPAVDYDVTFVLTRSEADGKHYGAINGGHDKFPNYEGRIGEKWRYAFTTTYSTGLSTIYALNSNVAFTTPKGRILGE